MRLQVVLLLPNARVRRVTMTILGCYQNNGINFVLPGESGRRNKIHPLSIPFPLLLPTGFYGGGYATCQLVDVSGDSPNA